VPALPEAGETPHILMVSHYFEDHRGGIEIVAGRLARELAKIGYRVTWAATGARLDNPAWQALALKAWNGTERAFGVPLPIPAPASAERLAQACASADAIIVHDGLYPTSVVARLAGRRARKPVMIVQHIGAVAYRNPLPRLLMQGANALIARPMLRSADQIVFISETTRAHFALSDHCPTATIFNGVDVDIFRPAANRDEQLRERAALGLPPDRKIALFVGRFVEKKGLHWLRGLAERHDDMIWALAGWGPIDPEGWGLPNVRVFRDLSGASLAGLYRAADLFTLPSIGEGFPLVIQEALACGLPVVCSSEVATADPAASHLLHGVPLDEGQPDQTLAALADAVIRLASSPSNPAERHAFARAHYSWASAAACYDQLLKAMMHRCGGRA
jgi:glycosyltransferase involved in cell wall biosynthesis